jgi:hypothetical protein
MPFRNQLDIIRPFLLVAVPQKTPEIAFVMLDCPGTFTVGTLSENESFSERLNGCANGYL